MQIVSTVPRFLEMNWTELSFFSLNTSCRKDTNDYMETKSQSITKKTIFEKNLYSMQYKTSVVMIPASNR